MSEINMFEEASRQKLRFQTTAGFISTEDLWDLTLKKLDDIAVAINEKISATAKSSFLTPKSSPNETMSLALSILIHIITAKQEEAKKSKDAAERRAQRAKLLEMVEKKKDSELEGLSVEDLMKKIEAL